jgi:tetratricopeptide (TPR) repeat protein
MAPRMLGVILCLFILSCKQKNLSSSPSKQPIDNVDIKDKEQIRNYIVAQYAHQNYIACLLWDSIYYQTLDFNDTVMMVIRMESRLATGRLGHASALLDVINENRGFDKYYNYYFSARLCAARGELNKARLYLDSAVKAKPLDEKAFAEIADFYDGIGDVKTAIAYLGKAIQLKGENAYYCYVNIGVMYTKISNYESAAYFFRRAIHDKDVEYFAYFNYALCQYRLNHTDSSFYYFDKALKLNNEDFRLPLERGKLYYLTGKKKNACEDWSRAVELKSIEASSLLTKNCD